MAIIPQSFLDSVVAIGHLNEEKKKIWDGTGFFYGIYEEIFDDSGKYSVYLVTNKHILEGLSEIFLKFNIANGKSNEIKMELLIGAQESWTGHPNKLDIAVIEVDMNVIRADFPSVDFFTNNNHSLTLEKMKEYDINEGDFVYIVGFPINIAKDHQNTAIVRSGSLAQISDVKNQNNNEFLIDAPIFPGNSGSPVILRPEDYALDGSPIFNCAVLLGIIDDYYTYNDYAHSTQTLDQRVIFQENASLGAAYPVDMINETIYNHEKKSADRLKIVIQRAIIISDTKTIQDVEELAENRRLELEYDIEEKLDQMPDFMIKKIMALFNEKEIKDFFIKEQFEGLKEELGYIKDSLKDPNLIKHINTDVMSKLKDLIHTSDSQLEKISKKIK